MVCASTGNFGQAMAFACEKHSLPLTVFADLGANPVKLDRVRSLGAEVRLEGNDFDEAKERGKEFAERCNAWFVEDGREPEISEGAGTIAVELLAGQEEYDVFLIPLGNGALLTGNARWIKANSNAKVIGVSADGADSMEKSWRSGNIVQRDRVDTISEGIAVRVPVPEAVADMAGIVDEVLLVSDQRTIQAMRIIHEHTDVAVEPAAAVGVAAILDWPEAFAGQRVATILTGSNLTKDQAGSWLS